MGVNVAGYLTAESGVGELGRALLSAIEAAGIPASTHGYGRTQSRQTVSIPVGHTQDVAPYDINIVTVNADQLPYFVRDAGSDFFQGRHTIAYWAWEVEQFPRTMAESAQLVDEVWALSHFAASAVAQETDRSVMVFPPPVLSAAAPPLTRADLRLPDDFLFLFCFDFLSVFERKNPLAVIDAFSQAFHPGEGAALVIKSVNGTLKPAQLKRLQQAAEGHPDVVVMDRYLAPDRRVALMNLCDAYVSLHRSEGFGFTIAEAMAFGKPAIATNYSGNLEFMTPENSYLVPFELIPIKPGCGPYPETARWADPDVAVASSLMREVFDERDGANERGAQAREDILSLHSPEARVEPIRSRLETIVASVKVTADRVSTIEEEALSSVVEPPIAGTQPAIEAAGEAIARGPDVGSRARYGFVSRTARRAAMRFIRNYDEYQRGVDERLLDAIRQIDRRLEERFTSVDALGAAAEEARASVVDLRSELSQLHEAVRSLRADHLSSLDEVGSEIRAQFANAFDDLQQQVMMAVQAWQDGEKRVAALAKELRTLPFMSDPDTFTSTDGEGRTTLAYEDRFGPPESRQPIFEEIFRGPESLIRERQAGYVDLLRNHTPVIDIGAGRGEMLEMLAETGIDALGVDLSPELVAHCRAKGLKIEEGDAIDFLEAQPDNSLGAVFSAQVIEHLDGRDLVALLETARRKIRPGGVFIAETVNPHALFAFKTFWVDPTHRTPLFPEVVLALCRDAGFEKAHILFPFGIGDAAHDRWTQGEYAVVASPQ